MQSDPSGGGTGSGSGPSSFHYFVDAAKYAWAASAITGAQIKAQLPPPTNTFKLYQEGRGGDPDREITDSDSISLDPSHGGVARFYTAPNATFGTRSEFA